MALKRPFKPAFTLAVSALAFSTVSATAADLDPPTPEAKSAMEFYAKIYGGAAFNDTERFTGVIAPGSPVGAPGTPFFVNLDYNTGFQVGGAAGVRFKNAYGAVSPRLELDVNFNRFGVNNNSTFNGGNQIFNGNQSFIFAGVNALADFDITGNGKILPFIGVGVGAVFQQSSVVYNPAGNAAVNVALNNAGTSLGLQLLGGVEYKLTDNIGLSIEGRYLRVFDASSDRTFLTPPGPGFFGRVSSDVDIATVGAGLRYSF